MEISDRNGDKFDWNRKRISLQGLPRGPDAFVCWEGTHSRHIMGDILSYYAPSSGQMNHTGKLNDFNIDKRIKYNYDGRNLTSKIGELLNFYEKSDEANCLMDLCSEDCKNCPESFDYCPENFRNCSIDFQNCSENFYNHQAYLKNYSEDPQATACEEKTPCQQNLTTTENLFTASYGFMETPMINCEKNTKIDHLDGTNCNCMNPTLIKREKFEKINPRMCSLLNTSRTMGRCEHLEGCAKLMRKSREHFYREYRRYSKRKPRQGGKRFGKSVSFGKAMRSRAQQTSATESLDRLVSEFIPNEYESNSNTPGADPNVSESNRNDVRERELELSVIRQGSYASYDEEGIDSIDQAKQDVKTKTSNPGISPEHKSSDSKSAPDSGLKNATWETIPSTSDYRGYCEESSGKKYSKSSRDSKEEIYSKSPAVKIRDSRAQLLKSNLEKIHKGLEIFPQPMSCGRTRRLKKHPLLDRKPKGIKSCKRKPSKRDAEKRRKSKNVQFLKDVIQRGLEKKLHVGIQSGLEKKSNVQIQRGLEKNVQILKSENKRIIIHANTLIVSCAKEQYVQVLDKISKINVKKVIISCERKGNF